MTEYVYSQGLGIVEMEEVFSQDFRPISRSTLNSMSAHDEAPLSIPSWRSSFSPSGDPRGSWLPRDSMSTCWKILRQHKSSRVLSTANSQVHPAQKTVLENSGSPLETLSIPPLSRSWVQPPETIRTGLTITTRRFEICSRRSVTYLGLTKIPILCCEKGCLLKHAQQSSN